MTLANTYDSVKTKSDYRFFTNCARKLFIAYICLAQVLTTSTNVMLGKKSLLAVFFTFCFLCSIWNMAGRRGKRDRERARGGGWRRPIREREVTFIILMKIHCSFPFYSSSSFQPKWYTRRAWGAAATSCYFYPTLSSWSHSQFLYFSVSRWVLQLSF